MLATVPLNVRLGYAVSVKLTFCPGCTLPMSASLTEALICGMLRSVSVANAPLELLEEEEDDDDEDEEVDDDPELTGPPPIHCPTAPFRLAIVPFAGATSVAAARLFCAVCSAACAPATCAVA